MCYVQVFIISECSWFYFTQRMFISAFISVIMNWYKLLRNDTIEYIFSFPTQLHIFNLLFTSPASLELNLGTLRKERLIKQKF